jgi:hypothetical protein
MLSLLACRKAPEAKIGADTAPAMRMLTHLKGEQAADG